MIVLQQISGQLQTQQPTPLGPIWLFNSINLTTFIKCECGLTVACVGGEIYPTLTCQN